MTSISRDSKKLIISVITMVLISFSPLLNQYIIISALLLLIIFHSSGVQFKKDSRTILLLSCLLVFIINALLDVKNAQIWINYSPLNIYYPLAFLFGYIISQKYSLTDFFRSYHKVIFPFAILSLVGVFVFYFFPDIVAKLPSYSYYNTTHKTAIIFNIGINPDGSILKRNSGIAWEPGAFQFLLNLGLFSYLRLNTKKTSFFVVIIYIIAIFFTRSTAGFLILLFQIISIAKTKKGYLFVLAGIVALFSTSIFSEINYQLSSKLIGSHSFELRYRPMIEAYKHGAQNLLGLGNTGYNNLLYYYNINSYDSYSQIVVRYGFPLLILVCFGLARVFKYNILLFLIIFITFFSETIWFLPFITPFYFYHYEDVKKNIRYNGGKIHIK